MNLRTGEKRIETENGVPLKTNGPDFEKYDLLGMEAKLSALREAAQALDADIVSMKENLRVEMQRLENIDPDEGIVEAQNYERQERIVEELEQKIVEAEKELRGLGEEIQAEISEIQKIEAKMREATEKADEATRMDMAYLSAMGFDTLAPADSEYLFTELIRVSEYNAEYTFNLMNGPRFSDTDTAAEKRLPAFQDLMVSIMATPEFTPESSVRVSIESERDKIIPMEQKDAHAMWRDCGLVDDGGTFQRGVFQERVQAGCGKRPVIRAKGTPVFGFSLRALRLGGSDFVGSLLASGIGCAEERGASSERGVAVLQGLPLLGLIHFPGWCI